MTRRRALLISHGQPSEPERGEAEIATLARAVSDHLPGIDLRGVTLAGDGTLEAALDGAGPGSLAYPLFMADGWFVRDQLPKRIGSKAVHILPPFGMDAGLPGFAATWLRGEIAGRGWRAPEVTLAVLGHGSGRSDRPAQVTRGFAEAVAAQLGCALRLGFVEQAPLLTEALEGIGAHSIALPFFAARRGHVLDDLPEAARETGFDGVMLDPIGLHPEIPAFIAARLRAALDAGLGAG